MNSPVDGRDRKRKGRTQQQQQQGGLRCMCLEPHGTFFFYFIFILLMIIYKVSYNNDDASTPPPPLNAASLRLPPSLYHHPLASKPLQTMTNQLKATTPIKGAAGFLFYFIFYILLTIYYNSYVIATIMTTTGSYKPTKWGAQMTVLSFGPHQVCHFLFSILCQLIFISFLVSISFDNSNGCHK